MCHEGMAWSIIFYSFICYEYMEGEFCDKQFVTNGETCCNFGIETGQVNAYSSREILTRALVGSVYNATWWWWGTIFCPPPYLRNYWTDPQSSNGVQKPCHICRQKSNFIDLGVTDDVTGQVKDKMFCRSPVF